MIELPLMSDPASLATLDVLTKLGPPALFTDMNLYSLIACCAVNLSLERGNCDASCGAYIRLGMTAGPNFGDYQAGYRFGRLGYELAERRGLKRYQGNFGHCVLPWTKHVKTGRDLIHGAIASAMQIGDLTFAAFSSGHLNSNMLAAGDALIDVQREAERGLALVRNARFGFYADIIATQLAFVRTLRGLTRRFGSFDDEEFNEVQIARRLSNNPNFAIAECWYWIRKLQACFLAGDHTAAVQASLEAQRLLWTSSFLFESAEYHLYSALCRAASCDHVPADQRQQQLDALAVHQRQLQVWAANCPENFENRAALVDAEIARIEGRELDAERLYEQAIGSARANGFIHNEALAYELAARFYAARGFKQIADLYLRNARYGYIRWGAVGKVRQLDETHPDLRAEDSLPGPKSTIGTPVEQLDLATVIKVSQAVSGEIALESLIDTLMRTAMEQAGAERALLIMPSGQEPRIEAEATTSGDTVTVRLVEEAVTERVVPESVLHYVLRTREIVILDDAAAQSPFGVNSYIRQRQARSIFCLPLLNQAKLVGVLYLENNLTPRVFAPARISVLKLLASQAAIALENARLYRDVEERERKIRRLVNSNVVGIFIWDFDGRFLEANDEFLRMVGYDREDQLAGSIRWTDLTPPDWRDRNNARIEQQKSSGRFEPFEKEYTRKDGSRVPVLIGGATFEEGGNQGVAFVLDLTERKRGEEALRESEAKFRDYAETASDWFWEIGPDYKFTLLTEKAFGSHSADRIGTACWDHALDLETEPEKWRLVRATLDARKPFRDFVYRGLDGNGSPMYVKASGRPVFDANGEFRGYRGTGTDVTALRAVEAEARENERRYREAQLELAHANRVAAMGQLTASITHEVNQPITAAVTYASAARRFLSAEPPNFREVDDALSLIVKEGNRAGEVVGRIRALIKKAPARKDVVAINDAILEVIALTRTEAANNSVSVRTQLAEGLPPVQGDRVQLQQVLLNLIINAIEAMRDVGEKERQLLISTRNEPDGVSVEVRDSGPGFAPATPDRVFEAFYTTKPSGLGLGLSICRSIIEAHNGQLRASANLPCGASFQFALPAIGSTAS